MKVVIIGTRGIPNRYGGFEQFAEKIAVAFVEKGIDISVYCPNYHNNFGSIWKGVHLIHKYCLEFINPSFSQFIYDLLCILDSRKRKFDIIYHLGYTSSSVWFGFHPNNAVIITNMDGIEWKRKKYNWLSRKFLKYAEKRAFLKSDRLIADSIQIKKYLDEKYNTSATYISYPALCVSENELSLKPPTPFIPNQYYLVICRLQSDNNPEMIIEGYLKSKATDPLIIIGNYKNRYGHALKTKFKTNNIIFYGAVYDQTLLNQIRFHAKLYFHGHSAGGTNPSLLEAMASKSLICAHNNPYNKEVLGENAFFFNDSNDIALLLQKNIDKNQHQSFITNNCRIIDLNFKLNNIVEQYLNLFNTCLNKKSE